MILPFVEHLRSATWISDSRVSGASRGADCEAVNSSIDGIAVAVPTPASSIITVDSTLHDRDTIGVLLEIPAVGGIQHNLRLEYIGSVRVLNAWWFVGQCYVATRLLGRSLVM